MKDECKYDLITKNTLSLCLRLITYNIYLHNNLVNEAIPSTDE